MPFPLSREYVSRAEETLGAQLPIAYVSLLMRNNGGSVLGGKWHLHPIRDDSSRKRLGRTTNDILHETKWASGYPTFPRGAVAIASNGTADQLVLLRSETLPEFEPRVYWWYHDTGDLSVVAEDFLDLVSA